jgi:hypothetical protein
LCSATAAAVSPAEVNGTRTTAVVSRNANGPSSGGAFSQDGRTASLYAFSSEATNLVGSDTNGVQDVFVLHRNGMGGGIERVSVSSGGAQANGDSSSPSVDGTNGRSPHCVAFQSNATNLDSDDTSPDSDTRTGETGGRCSRHSTRSSNRAGPNAGGSRSRHTQQRSAEEPDASRIALTAHRAASLAPSIVARSV